MLVFLIKRRKAVLILTILLVVYLLGRCSNQNTTAPITTIAPTTVYTIPTMIVPTTAEASNRLMIFLSTIHSVQFLGLLLLTCPIILLIGGIVVWIVNQTRSKYVKE